MAQLRVKGTYFLNYVSSSMNAPKSEDITEKLVNLAEKILKIHKNFLLKFEFLFNEFVSDLEYILPSKRTLQNFYLDM
jgi:hypothetical protein